MTNRYNIKYSRQEYRDEYLKTDEWKEKSVHILRRDPICRICDKIKSVDCHHLTYDNLPFEQESDLIGVCRKCHTFVHKHKELATESNLVFLKKKIDQCKKTYSIGAGLLNVIMNKSIQLQRKVAGLLKLPISQFDTLLNKRIAYFQLQKIVALIEGPKPIEKIEEPRRVRSISKSRKTVAPNPELDSICQKMGIENGADLMRVRGQMTKMTYNKMLKYILRK